MPGSSFGNLFRIHTFGESHGAGLGAIVDGCPAGLFLEEKDIQTYLDRRKPGQSNISTPRKEADKVEILSGVFEGQTTGTPIAMLVRNTSQKSKDYSALANCYRPGHADFTFDEKFGHRDYRGGGRSSGRETIGRVAAGAIAAKLLSELNIRVMAYTKSIGPVSVDMTKFNEEAILNTPTAMPDEEASAEAEVYLKKCMEEKDSAGGVIECKVFGLPAGIGEPVFDKLDANLAKALMSIGAVKAVEIGDGVNVAMMHGSENNDPFMTNEEDFPEIADRIPIIKKTNHSGGTLGGISDGSELIIRAYVKPTPSIFRPQQTVDTDGENVEITIKGRHDPVIVPRAVVVVESMVALTVADLLLTNMTSQMEHVRKIYNP
ncbi:MAG: chorismate synthase [Lachnospiraceae bacterium]|nr:chorismate synthase [Lachnospiraceae bacterium]